MVARLGPADARAILLQYFDGSQVGECPEDYVLPDIVHEQAAPPSHAEWVRRGHIRRGSSIVELYHDPYLDDLPKPMARIIAAQRIVNMARGRQGRNRLRAQEASLAFDSFKEKDASAADALAHSKGWVFIPASSATLTASGVHSGTMSKKCDAVVQAHRALEGELRLERLQEEKAKQLAAAEKEAMVARKRAENEARRREHQAMMKKGAEDIMEQVNAAEARRMFKEKERETERGARQNDEFVIGRYAKKSCDQSRGAET